MAPEVKAGFYSFPADVYSMGLVLYEILELKLPPWDKSLDHIIFPEKYQFQQIIEPLIRNDSSQRLSAKDSLNYFDNQLVKVVVDNIRKAYPDIIKVDEELFDTARLLEYLEKELSSKNPNYDDLFLINKEN